VQFAGKDEAKFRSFDAKLKAIGSTKGWHNALMDENHAPEEDESADSKQKSLRKERIENDSKAMTCLTLACIDKAFPFVEDLSSACEMCQLLCEQHKLIKAEDCSQLLMRFVNLKLEDEAEDPIESFLEMEHTNHVMEKIDKKCKKEELEMIVVLFSKLPKLHSETIAIEMRNVSKSDWKSVKRSVRESHQRNCPIENNDSTIAPLKSANQALATTNQSMTSPSQNMQRGNRIWKKNWNKRKNYKGFCACCGKQGHRATECRDLPNQQQGNQENSKNDAICWKCGQKGHYKSECKNTSESNHLALTVIDSTTFNSMNLIGDSASTTNIANDISDLTNPICIKETVIVGGNKKCTSIAKGTWTLEDEVKVELENTLCVPDFGRKVMSFPLSLDQDGVLFGEGHFLKMTMPDMTECQASSF